MSDKCAIWGTPAHVVRAPEPTGVMRIDSPRAGGVYLIARDEELALRDEYDGSCKARLTTWMVDQRYGGNLQPKVTRKDIDNARTAQRISVPDGADRVLRCLAQKLEKEEPGTSLAVDAFADEPHWTGEDAPGKAYLELLAHLESPHATDGGLNPLLQELEDGGLIGKLRKTLWRAKETPPPLHLTVTVPGFKRAKELAQEASTADDRVFVAMWFDDSMKDASERGIKAAIEDAGYKPVRVDEEQFSEKVDDRIISEIRRSRFVVADFSHGKKGARGSVYFEAGFAKGLGLEVIFTCRDPNPGKPHFDTRQYPHIMWKDVDELRTKLALRITAIMGEGPLKGKKPE